MPEAGSCRPVGRKAPHSWRLRNDASGDQANLTTVANRRFRFRHRREVLKSKQRLNLALTKDLLAKNPRLAAVQMTHRLLWPATLSRRARSARRLICVQFDLSLTVRTGPNHGKQGKPAFGRGDHPVTPGKTLLADRWGALIVLSVMRVLGAGLLAATTGLILMAAVVVPSGNLGLASESSPQTRAEHRIQYSSRNSPRRPRSLWVVHHQLVTSICRMSVENRDGQQLGEVDDFIVDANSGQVTLVVIASGGWLGVSKKLRAVPSQLLSTATAKLGIVALDVGWRRWDRAPIFKRSDLRRFNSDPSAVEALRRYYMLPAMAAHQNVRPVISSESTGSLQHDRGVRRYEFAHAMIGRKVVDSTRTSLGEISDVLIDLADDRPTLAILSGKFAVGLFNLKFYPDGHLRVNVAKGSFLDAPVLDDNSWEPVSNSRTAVIYRLPGRASDTPRSHASQSPDPVHFPRFASAASNQLSAFLVPARPVL